jgi:NAD(P)-dependent dehydrogenase (short-subunit alcohol dehydrogenase family)
MEVRDRIAIVTGGGGTGMGRTISLALVGAGAKVVVADVDEEGGAETVRQVQSAEGEAAFVRADVTAEEDVRRMVDLAVDTFGGLDILVNNAGMTPGPHFPDAPVEHWTRYLELNLRAPMLAIQHALEPMKRRGGGAIVNLSSAAGIGFRPHSSPEYAAAKAGLVRLTATLAPLAETANIRVNCIVPNWIGTPEVRAEIPLLSAEERAEVPDELIPPEDIADAVLRFVEDDSQAGRVLLVWNDEAAFLVPLDSEPRK